MSALSVPVPRRAGDRDLTAVARHVASQHAAGAVLYIRLAEYAGFAIGSAVSTAHPRGRYGVHPGWHSLIRAESLRRSRRSTRGGTKYRASLLGCDARFSEQPPIPGLKPSTGVPPVAGAAVAGCDVTIFMAEQLPSDGLECWADSGRTGRVRLRGLRSERPSLHCCLDFGQ
jgi:hypothetical protein